MSDRSTLGVMLANGDTLMAYHELIYPECTHGAEMDLRELIARLGGDFHVVDNRARFVAMLQCSACGRKGNMTIQISRSRDKMGLR